MLSFLKISDLAILHDVDIEFGPGLNVLTGETGAGKSIVVDAIGLVLGSRGAAELVREGSERLRVEAQFDLLARPDGAQLLAAAGEDGEPEADPGALVVRRELTTQGRGRIHINDRLATLTSLRSLGELLADLHGQHQHQSLLRPEGQRDALDRFAGTIEARHEAARLHAELGQLQSARQDLSQGEADRLRRQESLTREAQEIEAAAIRPGEDADLAREESLLRNAAEVARLAGESFTLLSDDDDAVIARLAGAGERLRRLAVIDPEAARAAALADEARLAAAEAAASLSRYLDGAEFDPGRLEGVASRLNELARLKKRYGPTLEDVVAHRDRCRSDLDAITAGPGLLADLDARIETAGETWRRAAEALSERRSAAAARLAKCVAGELDALGMGGTRVEIAVDRMEDGAGGPAGLDRIEFLIAPNAGEGLRPLARIASGGELSRLMLALRNATAGQADTRLLIFDEVDSGVGGRVAETVGERLAALARRQQVLCVTHLPQIAALADHHYLIRKATRGGRTRAEVERLDGKGRIDELARMLGGSPEATARRHAEAMMSRRRGSASA
jgi:DNA repair protein RecN (Recombination protein N)